MNCRPRLKAFQQAKALIKFGRYKYSKWADTREGVVRVNRLVSIMLSTILCVIALAGCAANTQPPSDEPAEVLPTPVSTESNDSWIQPLVPAEPLPTPTVTEAELEDSSEFLISTYGFSAGDLEGINTEAFVDDYELRTRDYSSEQVHGFFERNKDIYELSNYVVVD